MSLRMPIVANTNFDEERICVTEKRGSWQKKDSHRNRDIIRVQYIRVEKSVRKTLTSGVANGGGTILGNGLTFLQGSMQERLLVKPCSSSIPKLWPSWPVLPCFFYT